MFLTKKISQISQLKNALVKEKGQKTIFELILAERKLFLGNKKLQYIGTVVVNEEEKCVYFSEMLKETGFGLEIDLGTSSEVYSTGLNWRKGNIKADMEAFGKKYKYDFDIESIRKAIEAAVVEEGYKFEYKIFL